MKGNSLYFAFPHLCFCLYLHFLFLSLSSFYVFYVDLFRCCFNHLVFEIFFKYFDILSFSFCHLTGSLYFFYLIFYMAEYQLHFWSFMSLSIPNQSVEDIYFFLFSLSVKLKLLLRFVSSAIKVILLLSRLSALNTNSV